MLSSTWALLGYITITALLALAIPTWRAVLTVFAGRKSNSFTPSGTDISPLFERVCRAHANCYENFPLIGGMLILALLTETTQITNALAGYLLAARLLQSIVHIISTNEVMVTIRFTLYYVQLLIIFSWIIKYVQLL